MATVKPLDTWDKTSIEDIRKRSNFLLSEKNWGQSVADYKKQSGVQNRAYYTGPMRHNPPHGYLKKLGQPSLFGASYKKRFFRLEEGGVLAYYADKPATGDRSNLKGTIQMKD